MKVQRQDVFQGLDEQLVYALKLGYLYATLDEDVAAAEASDALGDALCNLIGDDAFCAWLEEKE